MGETPDASRLEQIAEIAHRRGRINHPEGARYAVVSWDDVTYLLGFIEAQAAEIADLKKRLGYPDFARGGRIHG